MPPSDTTLSPEVEAALRERFLGKVSIQVSGDRTCWRWDGSRDRKGYGRIRASGRMQFAHRVAWVLYRGAIPDGMHVLHRCDQPWCVNHRHLFLGTNSDNVQDKVLKGRQATGDKCGARGDANGSRAKRERLARGERHGSAVLTESDVQEIRRRRAVGELLGAIAADYGVSRGHVGDIARGRKWAPEDAAIRAAKEADRG